MGRWRRLKSEAQLALLAYLEASGGHDPHQSASKSSRLQLAPMRIGWKIAGMKTGMADHGRILAPLAFAAMVACCAPGDEEVNLDWIPDDVYVQVMTELMLLDATPPTGATVAEQEAKADSIRSEILAAQGVTARELLDFAEALGSEAAHMESLWERITQKYDSTRIANLREETEARSEPEGKLGAEARAGAADSTPAAGGPGDDVAPRTHGKTLALPGKSRPGARDTTVPPS